ncbi:MAG: Mrp/NBP35 family ATP-binding protein [Clostridia bacterium]|nr:Mrp/NBP35 family ATP-binding protein [Clostridia bacterium]
MSEEKNYEVEVEECTHDCSTCSANCSSKPKKPTFTPVNQYSKVDKLIGVVSGKGGVGKSLVTCLSAVELRRRGLKTAILDADITGPSIPKAFGLHGMCEAAPLGGIMPMTTKTGIDVMSVNLLMEDETNPVVWRGPVISGTVQQFWTDVVWGDVDCMVIDCPPGTGDVPLTLFQSLPLDGIIIVTSPQDLVSMIVAKAVNMAKLMNIPIIGIVENMSYLKCPDCGKEIKVFGESNIDAIAAEYGIPVLAKLPIDPTLASLCDAGAIELCENDLGKSIADAIEAQPMRADLA